MDLNPCETIAAKQMQAAWYRVIATGISGNASTYECETLSMVHIAYHSALHRMLTASNRGHEVR